ncbi:Glutamine--fructose-6-phosphate aminotransferase [isomerizing] [hydrothermal vent metagenome]|uniref:Glutamine--fructose-6-phosphate aminotransferase [isomerizing] n=1 Tax=hydrothermal vent metagenome TaxID=652676 RepID=A0A3B0QQ31_9ZZZZ
MCGIVGYVGQRSARDVIIAGLRKLEYRGYDSAGIAVFCDGDGSEITLERSEGKLRRLVDKLDGKELKGRVGIGHTRWATHGRPSEANAHPHMEGGVAVVHNGIIENYLALRSEMSKEGAVFRSETDTEIIAHLIDREIKKGSTLQAALRAACKKVRGSYALAAISRAEPGVIVAAKKECPLVIGIGEGESVVSSDVTAILDITRRAVFLEDGELAILSRDGLEVTDLDGEVIVKEERTIDWSPVMAEKGGYRHFMLKETHEQPRAVIDTFRGNLMEEAGDIFLDGFDLDLTGIERIYLVACGTSWHAALVGKFLIEDFSGVPVEVDLGSEFRYRNPLVSEKTLVVAISQSGETADTLAAVKEAKAKGAKVVAVSNVVESSIPRLSDWTLYTHAGPEIGVASTKAFTTQLVSLYMFALYLGRRAGTVDAARGVELIRELVELPGKMEAALASEREIMDIAKRYFHYRDFLYLGRGINYPIALEGALKLKEISYIHAEGYPAGEMKHGPIALIDEDMPVVVLAPKDAHYPKVLSNMQEVKARGGRIIAVVGEGDSEVSSEADDVIVVPEVSTELSPIIMTLPLQLLAYHIAVLKGTDVDQPRNLAKSVTVE